MKFIMDFIKDILSDPDISIAIKFLAVVEFVVGGVGILAIFYEVIFGNGGALLNFVGLVVAIIFGVVVGMGIALDWDEED